MSGSILVADDDAHLRAGLVDLLTLEGYACVGEADGASALTTFRRTRPSLCLLDVMMPALDGLALCRMIRNEDVHVPILLLSARGDEMDRVIGLEVGADDYIAKPFGAREMLARIKAALRRARLASRWSGAATPSPGLPASPPTVTSAVFSPLRPRA